jgi:carbonic anhydrase
MTQNLRLAPSASLQAFLLPSDLLLSQQVYLFATIKTMYETRGSLTIKPVLTFEDIPAEYLNTPVAELFAYQNLNEDFKKHENPGLVVVMCMDNRKQLHIPNKFAYIIRTPGARIFGFEFALSFPIAIANIHHVALIAHTECGMVHLTSKREQVVQGLINNAGWAKEDANTHFNSFAPLYEIENETRFVYEESLVLKHKYPKVNFIPLLYKVKDHRLYLIEA